MYIFLIFFLLVNNQVEYLSGKPMIIYGIMYTFISLDINIWLPTLKIYVQTFHWEKLWVQNALPSYSLDSFDPPLSINSE